MTAAKRRIAHDIVLNAPTGEITIEGTPFPFHVLEEPEISLLGEGMPAALHVAIITDNLTYHGHDGTTKVLATGSERAESEWAKRRAEEIVYDGLRDVIEWLGRCELARQNEDVGLSFDELMGVDYD